MDSRSREPSQYSSSSSEYANEEENNNNEKKENPNKITYSVKFLTLGESSVGKTSIISKLVDNTFSHNHLSTTGIDSKNFTINYNDNTSVRISIWDTAGQERYKNIASSFYNKVDGILLVYDITNNLSFERINDWLVEVNKKADSNKVGFVLVGNKCDLDLERNIPTEKGKQRAEELHMPFYETSAKTGENIKEAIATLCQETIKKMDKNKNRENSRTSKLEDANKNENDIKKKKCC